MASFSAAVLSEITGGVWLNNLMPSGELSVSTDTRTDNRGMIFFALSGENFDAHNFLEQAVSSGCQAVCIKREKQRCAPENIPVLLVEDPLRAMQKCAEFHRLRFPELTLLGVTGSVGKTSVKEMLRAICIRQAGKTAVLATSGNTNNQIGVAMNLLKLDHNHRYAVIEAGTSSPGEIAPLSRMMHPSGAIVNSIAPCHLEQLIDLNGVAAEKGNLFRFMPEYAPAVFPADTAGKDLLKKAADKYRTVTFGLNDDGDISAVFKGGDLAGSSFDLKFPDGRIFNIRWHLTGMHNALNAAGAAALAYAVGIEPEVIAEGLPETSLPGMRMKKTVVSGITYFNDAYNANPASMHASVNLLASAPPSGRLIMVLGGMRELGETSLAEHRRLLDEIREKLPDATLICIGKEFAGLSGNHFFSAGEAGVFLTEMLRPGDTVFAKGSRGNAVEKALPPEAR